MFAKCIFSCDFCSMGTLVRRKKTWPRLQCRKVLEFGQLMVDIIVYVSCKFEMCIFKIAQVISENVQIAFLYVLSIYKDVKYFHNVGISRDFNVFSYFQENLLCYCWPFER